jgi:hypothetical protein
MSAHRLWQTTIRSALAGRPNTNLHTVRAFSVQALVRNASVSGTATVLPERGRLARNTTLLLQREELDALVKEALEEAPVGVSKPFYAQFRSTWQYLHEQERAQQKPKLSTINRIAQLVKTGADCELLLPVIGLWQRVPLPLTAWTTRLVMRQCNRQRRPDLALTLLSDRAHYAPQPREQDMIELITAFEKEATQAATQEDETRVELSLDRMYTVFALCPYYEIPWSASLYERLVEACARIPSETAWSRAVATAEEQRNVNLLSFGTAKIMYEGFQVRDATSQADVWSKLKDSFPNPQ